ncbi:MAG: hypothetical protein V1798_01415 [Pseudomonadota bacterium]
MGRILSPPGSAHDRPPISTKIAAAFDRRAEKDVQDILAINPTDEEWEFARVWARNYDANPAWPSLIDQLVTELKERQRG